MFSNKALLVVDVQNDFCPGGALAVPEGDSVIPPLNKYIEIFSKHDAPIFLSRDWHPRGSAHFKKQGGPWPVHCLADSDGAKFHPKLNVPEEATIISKGTAQDEDGYSAFDGRDEDGNSLLKRLSENNVKELYVGGLATDYCVKNSVLDALDNGFHVFLLSDAIRGVNQEPDDSKNAINEMVGKGAKKTTLHQLKLKTLFTKLKA